MTIKLCMLVRNRRYGEGINGRGDKCMRLCTNYKWTVYLFSKFRETIANSLQSSRFYLCLLLGFDHFPVEMLVFPGICFFSTLRQSPFSTLLKIRYFSKILKFYEFITHLVSVLSCKPASLDFVFQWMQTKRSSFHFTRIQRGIIFSFWKLNFYRTIVPMFLRYAKENVRFERSKRAVFLKYGHRSPIHYVPSTCSNRP